MHTAAAGLVFLDCNEEQTKKVTEYAERLVKGDDSIPLNDKSKQLQARVLALESELEESKTNYYNVQVEIDELREKYMKLQKTRQTEEFAEIIKSLTELKVQYIGNNTINQQHAYF